MVSTIVLIFTYTMYLYNILSNIFRTSHVNIILFKYLKLIFIFSEMKNAMLENISIKISLFNKYVFDFYFNINILNI